MNIPEKFRKGSVSGSGKQHPDRSLFHLVNHWTCVHSDPMRIKRQTKRRLVAAAAVGCALALLPALTASASPNIQAASSTTVATKTTTTPGNSCTKGRSLATHFTVVGTLTVVGSDSVTIDVQAGMRSLRGNILTIAGTASTTIRVDGTVTPMSDLSIGVRAVISGNRNDGTYTARKITVSTEDDAR